MSYAQLFKTQKYYVKVGEQFNLLDDALCECDWYLFPMEMQQIFITVMAGTQQPTIVQGFGNVLCTRETFSKVIFQFDFSKSVLFQ